MHMAAILPHQGLTGLERVIVIVFGVLFAWISIGFWEAAAGFVTLARGRDRFAITRTVDETPPPFAADVRAAIVMPIYNEAVDRVFARVRAVYESLNKTGRLDHFDIFVLSDTTDPDTWIAEEVAWAELCHRLGGFGRIYYRRRRENRKRKSGNIADFCRRWGRSYRYMIVFDADSMMTGQSLVKLVAMMELNEQVGIVQTCPKAVNRETLFGRVQQFANHVYSPVFAAGLHFLQLGDSHYWGHNAVIRLEPFMKYCALARLSGSPPLGGDILSHDFVEAALIRRAGWEVWLAYDLDGSYEEVPPTFIDELKRDRRWCQGNLQHVRLMFSKGLSPVHRALFMHGIMSYGSAMLWFLFLSLSTVEAIVEAFRIPDYFPTEHALFPTWPVWHFHWAITLLATTAILLFLPKLLSFLLIVVKQRQAGRFGGVITLSMGLGAEVLFSALFAPIRMIFHTKFLLMTLLGRGVGWDPPQRGDTGTRWPEALRIHGGGMILAAAWALCLYVYDRSFFWWNVPIFAPLMLSVPLTVWSSRVTVGNLGKKLGLFLIPEEISPPLELRMVAQAKITPGRKCLDLPAQWKQGFIQAIVDPRTNALHRWLLQNRTHRSSIMAQHLEELAEKALRLGPDNLSKKEKIELLSDTTILGDLHQSVWTLSSASRAERWGIPG